MFQRGLLCDAKAMDPRGRHVPSLLFSGANLVLGTNDWGNNRPVGPSHREGTFWCRLCVDSKRQMPLGHKVIQI